MWLLNFWRKKRPSGDHQRRGQVRFPVHGIAVVIIGHASGNPRSLSVSLVDQSDSGVRFWAGEQVEAGDTFTIEFDNGARRWATARHVEECEGQFVVGAQFQRTDPGESESGVDGPRECDLQEMRREPREEVSIAAQLSWGGPGGILQEEPSMIVDLSEFGARVTAPSTLPINTTIRLKTADFERVGVVRHCIVRLGHCLIGLHFARDPSDPQTSPGESLIERLAHDVGRSRQGLANIDAVNDNLTRITSPRPRRPGQTSKVAQLLGSLGEASQTETRAVEILTREVSAKVMLSRRLEIGESEADPGESQTPLV